MNKKILFGIGISVLFIVGIFFGLLTVKNTVSEIVQKYIFALKELFLR